MSDRITFTLDGREVTAASNQTIWEVSKGQGFVIPHLCHKDQVGYRSDGNCRMCMVEVKGERNLVASCIRKPAEGMVVETQSNRAQRHVRWLWSFSLQISPIKTMLIINLHTSGK